MRSTTALFRDRADAGRRLAARLEHLRSENPIVLGLARGGVQVAAEIAAALQSPLGVAVARKLGAPSQPELGIGAVAPGGVRIVDGLLSARLRISESAIDAIAGRETVEAERRLSLYSRNNPLSITGRTVILVDDGLATGVTALAAARSLRLQSPRKLVLAFPVASPQGLRLLNDEADELISFATPRDLQAVGLWYDDFAQIEDDEVVEILRNAARPEGPAAPVEFGASTALVGTREVRIDVGEAVLNADLLLPDTATSVVLILPERGADRRSALNRLLAAKVAAGSMGAVLTDLLTPTEQEEDMYSSHLSCDVGMLADRLQRIFAWLRLYRSASASDVGCFGSDCSASAALLYGASNPREVKAIVACELGPMPGAVLAQVSAPTLLIVGDMEREVRERNERALRELEAPEKRLEVLRGWGGVPRNMEAVQDVSRLASEWFARHLSVRSHHPQQ